MNKTERRLISTLFLITLTVACSPQVNQETPLPVSTVFLVSTKVATNTPTPLPSPSLQPTITQEAASLKQFQFMENIEPIPNYLTFFPKNLPSASGTYLLYKADGELMYTSYDRKLQSTILEFNPPYEYQDNDKGTEDEIHYAISQDADSPKVVLYTFESGNLSVWVMDLSGKLLRNWSGTVVPDSETVCKAPRVSPLGKWMVGSCNSNDFSYPYILDLEEGKGNYLTDDVSCKDPRNDGWVGFGWNATEQSFQTFCQATRYDDKIYTCFISTENWYTKCTYSGNYEWLISSSPDGNNGVRIDHIPDNEIDTPTNTVRIAMASPYCLLELEACNNKTTYELPLYKWFSTHLIATLMELKWSSSGNLLAWEITPRVGNGYGQTTTGVLNLKKPYDEIPFTTIRGTLLGFSPDEEWLLYKEDDSLVLLSVDNLLKQHLLVSPPIDGKIDFPGSMGWLVIP